MNVLRQDGKYEIISTSHRKIRYQESLQNRFFKTFLRGKALRQAQLLHIRSSEGVYKEIVCFSWILVSYEAIWVDADKHKGLHGVISFVTANENGSKAKGIGIDSCQLRFKRSCKQKQGGLMRPNPVSVWILIFIF